jgi:hypothetical protein
MSSKIKHDNKTSFKHHQLRGRRAATIRMHIYGNRRNTCSRRLASLAETAISLAPVSFTSTQR